MFSDMEKTALEAVCREMIETILLCMPNAFKGTIYRIGPPPDLTAERITSGIISNGNTKISWGLPYESEYNYPGKKWSEYRDEPGRALEAMAWCVEKQKSWTSEEPKTDSRNILMQVEGKPDDFFHMEPVLLHKSDAQSDAYMSSQFIKDYKDDLIWKESDYIVIAVIKIHFKPYTIKIGSNETIIMKRLSRSLGTELLSNRLRDDSMKTMQRLAKDRLNAFNILADSLRNAITKSALIFSLIKQEIGYLRDQWERMILENREEKDVKFEAIKELNGILSTLDKEDSELRKNLMDAHNKFLELSLPTEKGINWLNMQIKERWTTLLTKIPHDDKKEAIVWDNIGKLEKSLYFGQDTDIINSYKKIPDETKTEWVRLIYGNDDSFNNSSLDHVIDILDNSNINIPYQEKSKKALKQLKALRDTMCQLERNTNFLLYQVLNGGSEGLVLENRKDIDHLVDKNYFLHDNSVH
ncbi:MAG: hypothetical protein JXA79_02590 [Deltaproteobacteria bacterium]|nr:hypothetical protein [Deltaproteobacteria bacterium]